MGNRAISFDSATYAAERVNSRNSSVGRFELKKNGNSPGLMRRKRGHSGDSIDDYGWFEDFESSDPFGNKLLTHEFSSQPLQKALSLPPPATEPPLYILESNLETQQLWYTTAGRRPKQPQQEREYFEKLWKKNFENSNVCYDQSFSSSSHSPAKRMKQQQEDVIPKSEFNGEVLFRGKSPFSNSVSKSFLEDCVASVTIHMPYYRIFRGKSGEVHAEYLIKVTLGGNVPLTFGIWKRHSDFHQLAETITLLTNKTNDTNLFKNALLSWQCVLQRKRWFRSLDKDYLALKCFLLERFIHDVLFESQSPTIINKFLGLEN